MDLQEAILNALALIESLPQAAIDRALAEIDLADEAWAESIKALREESNSCPYCGGNCPNEPADSEHLCDEFAGTDDPEAQFYCQDCGHEADEEEFWPSDGKQVVDICPNCGSTNCFKK